MISSALPTSARLALLRGEFQTFHRYYVALFSSRANLGADTRSYTTEGEVTGPGYQPGGKLLAGLRTGTDKGAAWMTFDSASWPVSTVTARAAVIYNASLRESPILAVLDFGEDRSSTNGPFSITFPDNLISLE